MLAAMPEAGDDVEAAAQVPIPTAELTEEDFQRLWMMGLSGERGLGRPKEWDGDDRGFSDFAFKFKNWLSSMPGDVESLLDQSAKEQRPILMRMVGLRQRVVAKGVVQALRALAGGKALNIVKSVSDAGNGFEAWRLLHREYRPRTAGRGAHLTEQVMESRSADGQDYAAWYYDWLELVRQTEDQRSQSLDDDVKCAVVLKTAPKELRDHMVLESHNIMDVFSRMNQIVMTWMIARRMWSTTSTKSTSQSSAPKDPNAMDVGAMSCNGRWGATGMGEAFGKDGFGKDYGKMQ